MSASKYVVGIDLGTTNSSLAYIDTEADADQVGVEVLPVPQVVAPAEVEALPLLPSSIYMPGEHDLAPGSIDLPWAKGPDACVGVFARDHGATLPHRLVSSAKSWLCHPSADRRGAILPWGAEADTQRISPVDAATRVLSHLRDAWNHEIAGKKKPLRLENQEVTLTVPASFDAVARDLTVEAAREAGLASLTLLEEPQAAIYAWIGARGEEWRKQVRQRDLILVCDLGGGTTDLSLVAVDQEEGDVVLRRIAVGDHILLGGDNFDLALARTVEAAMGVRLDAWQLSVLWHACRQAKEKLLADEDAAAVPVVVPGRGSGVVGGTLRGELTREQVVSVLLEGFFPEVGAKDHPAQAPRTGLQELGLPYAQDPAVTKHVARFLAVHGRALTERGEGREGWGEIAHPTAILFNGGVFKSDMLRQRLQTIVSSWVQAEGGEPVRLLEGVDLDLAVARGAARYGWVRRGHGIRIRGGTAKAYYVGVETPMPAVPGLAPPVKAVCVAPFGMEEGTEADLADRDFGLIVGQAARFRFFGSSSRRGDEVGTVVERWEDEDIEELDPIEAKLESDEAAQGSTLAVRLRSVVTEVGTLEVWAVARDGKEKHRLEYRIRERGE